MTVLIYVNTSKQVGDPDHLKVFTIAAPRKPGSRRTIPRAWPSSIRFWKSALCPRQSVSSARQRFSLKGLTQEEILLWACRDEFRGGLSFLREL
jgi:hypothetical protein